MSKSDTDYNEGRDIWDHALLIGAGAVGAGAGIGGTRVLLKKLLKAKKLGRLTAGEIAVGAPSAWIGSSVFGRNASDYRHGKGRFRRK